PPRRILSRVTTLLGRRSSTLHGAACALAFVALPLGAWAPPPALAGGSQTMSATAGDVPRAEITNGLVTARFYLPDAERGHYPGNRFDRAGGTSSPRVGGPALRG